MVDWICQNNKAIINFTIWEWDFTKGHLHKEQVTAETDQFDIEHWEPWDNRHEGEFVNTERGKRGAARSFGEDEVIFEGKEGRSIKTQECIHWKEDWDYLCGKAKQWNRR